MALKSALKRFDSNKTFLENSLTSFQRVVTLLIIVLHHSRWNRASSVRWGGVGSFRSFRTGMCYVSFNVLPAQ